MASNNRYITMRRLFQLTDGIRQGKLQLDAAWLMEYFNISGKTLRRDLTFLADIGFITIPKTVQKEIDVQADMVDRAHQNPRTRRPYDRRAARLHRAQVTAEFERLAISLEPDLVNGFNIGRCNSCTYRFKLDEHGRIDMKDFRRHKERHP